MVAGNKKRWLILPALLVAGVLIYSLHTAHRIRRALRHYESGRELTLKREHLDANLELKAALDLHGGAEYAPEARYMIASNYMALERYREAEENYRRVIREFPAHGKAADSTFMLGMLYKNIIRDEQKAMEEFRAYLENFPDGKSAGEVGMYLRRMEGGR